MAARLFDQNNELRAHIAARWMPHCRRLLSAKACDELAHSTRSELRACFPLLLFQILHKKIMPNESSSFHEPLTFSHGAQLVSLRRNTSFKP
jgi:hypothetical protein